MEMALSIHPNFYAVQCGATVVVMITMTARISSGISAVRAGGWLLQVVVGVE